MHNKCFVVDNQMAVVGGRNIGNEYFGAGNAMVFADLDVLAMGPIVGEISAEFDLYWNSASAYPAAAILRDVPTDPAQLLAQFDQSRSDPESALYLKALRDTPLVTALRDEAFVVDWTSAQVLRDDPAKTLDTTDRTDVLLLDAMLRTIGPPKRSFDIVSPYFVPGEEGTAALARLASSGVAVRVLTNSLLSNDVKLVHAAYARRRVDLLRAGVQLFELKPSAATDAPASKALWGRSSSASLHAKTFAIDDARIFVGSFNFDPRSARLNTEMGLVIDSAALARRLSLQFETEIPLIAYEVRLTGDGNLEWIDRTASGERRVTDEPGGTAASETLMRLLGVLPIEWLL